MKSLNIGVTGSFDLFGFTVSTNNLTVQYSSTAHQLEFSGGIGIALSSDISGDVNLSRGGLIINTQTGALSVDTTNGLSLSGKLDLGGFKADADLSYSDTNGQLNLTAGANIEFPGNIDIHAGFSIVNNQLAAVNFAYQDSSPGIPLGDSGLFITAVSGAATTNLNTPSQIAFSGSVTVTAGESLTIAGKTFSLLSMTGTMTVSAQEFDLTGSVAMLGGLLGTSGSATLSLNWTTHWRL